MMKRYMYLTQMDFTLIYQYNSLYYLQTSQKKLNTAKDLEKNETLDRIFNYMEKRDILSTCNFKNLMKLCGFFY